MQRFAVRSPRNSKSSRVLCAAVAGTLAALVPSLSQATNVWDGEGSDQNWGTNANWGSNTAPTYSSPLQFGPIATSSVTPNNEAAALARTVGGIQFLASAPAYTVTGNAITLSGTISNASSATQTVNLDMTLSGSRVISSASGNTVVGGAISGTSGATLTVGSNTTFYTELKGASSYAGATTLGGWFRASGTNSGSGAINVFNNLLELNGLDQYDGNGNVTVSANGGISSGLISLSGGTSGTRMRAIRDVTLVNDLSTSGAYGASQINGTNSITFIGGTMTGTRVRNDIVAGKTLTLNNIQTGYVSSSGTPVVFTTNPTIFEGTGKTVVAGVISNTTAANAVNPGVHIARELSNRDAVTVFKGSNTYTGVTFVNNGVLRLDHQYAIPGGIDFGGQRETSPGVFFTGGNIQLGAQGNGGSQGVIGLGYDNFYRAIGSGPGQITWAQHADGSGGFAAYGADREVSLGGAGTPTPLTWSTGGFTFFYLILGAADADAMLDFKNPISFNNGSRRVVTRNGTAAVDARLSGVLSGGGTGGALNKDGPGTLELKAANTYTGQSLVTAGTLKFATLDSIVSTSRTTSTVFKDKLNIKAGASAVFNVGGSGEFDNTALNIIIPGLTGSNTTAQGAQAGSSIGFDTTYAATDFTIANPIANSTGTGGGAIGVRKLGANRLVLSASTNSYSGLTSVEGGTLSLNGANAGGGGASVFAGATLGGSGSLAGTINVGGTLAPGNSVESFVTGEVNFGAGSTFAYEIDSSEAAATANKRGDLQVVNGNLNLASTGVTNLTIADDAATDTVVPEGTIITMINYSGTWNGSLFTYQGNLLSDGEMFTAGLNNWVIDYDDDTNDWTPEAGGWNFEDDHAGFGYVTLTSAPVPEPTSLAMLAVGGMMLLRRRRTA